jgi:hypothetical protein
MICPKCGQILIKEPRLSAKINANATGDTYSCENSYCDVVAVRVVTGQKPK